MREVQTSMILALALALAACGGGGGGSGGAAASGGNVTYTGATAPAVITSTNANALAGDVIGGNRATGTLAVTGAVAAASKGPRVVRAMSLISAKMNQVTKSAAAHPGIVSGAVTSVSQTINCTISGTASVSGSIDNVTGIGSLTFTFNRCREATGTLNGSMTVAVNGYDVTNSVITDGSISFSAFTFSDGVTTVTMSGKLTDRLNQVTSTRTQTANFVAMDSASGQQIKLQNFQLVTVLSPSWVLPTSYTLQISGRIYDSAYGYVDVRTTSPLVFVTMQDPYPSSGGPLVLSGSPPSQVTVQPVDATTAQIRGVDANGNAFGPTNVLWANL